MNNQKKQGLLKLQSNYSISKLMPATQKANKIP